jgi:hypothetical protein
MSKKGVQHYKSGAKLTKRLIPSDSQHTQNLKPDTRL